MCELLLFFIPFFMVASVHVCVCVCGGSWLVQQVVLWHCLPRWYDFCSPQLHLLLSFAFDVNF